MEFEDSVAKVFRVELLRDKILGHVILDGNEVSTANIRTCRLVSKDWLHSTSKCLRKSKLPLYQLLLNKDNSVNATAYVRENGKLLDNFIRVVTGPSSSEQLVPPFKIKASIDFLRQENHGTFLECFNRCGSSLVDLSIDFPQDGGSMLFLFPTSSLPNLERCTLSYNRDTTRNLAEKEKHVGGPNAMYLTQQILTGCRQLRKLTLNVFSEETPYCFERLELSTAITELKLDCWELEDTHLKLLDRNPLPNLKRLALSDLMHSMPDDCIFNMFEKFKTRLTHFCTRSEYVNEYATGESTYFHFPVMEQLQVFESDSVYLELDSDSGMLENVLPNMHTLRLDNQTVEMFHKWTENSKLASVTCLVVSFVEVDIDFDCYKRFVSVSSEVMQSVNVTFPNLQTLEITVVGLEFGGLKFAFENLTHLRILKVNAFVDKSKDRDSWDALLLNIPPGLVKELRKTGDWDDAKLGERKKSSASVTNLTALRELVLRTIHDRRSGYPMRYSLISHLAFKYAFLEMPNLVKIGLGGRFMVSAKMKQEWEATGRILSYKMR